MKKALFSAMAMALLFVACKDKDDSTPKSEKWYISKSIELSADGNDTTVLSYHANNNIKEFYSTSDHSPYFYANLPVYEGGKIVGIQERSTTRPGANTVTAFVYTGTVLSRVNNYDYDITEDKFILRNYDSLVYANGKLSEVYEKRTGFIERYKLNWEGNNVKNVEVAGKETGVEAYTVYSEVHYTYNSKPAFSSLLNDNYNWLSDITNFENLSANSLVKEEVIDKPGEVVNNRTTSIYTYDDSGLLKEIETKEENLRLEPVHVQNFKTKFEYIKR